MDKLNNKIILGLVGPLSSGKGTTSQYLKEKYNAQVYRFSTILRDILDRLHLEQSRANMQDASRVLRETFGSDLLANVIAQDVSSDSAKIIVVDGVRREPDIKYLKELPDFHLVCINADQKIRHKRMTQRGENPDDNQKTFEQFQQDEQAEAEQQIKQVAKLAEFTIDNNGTIDQLHQQTEKILDEVRK